MSYRLALRIAAAFLFTISAISLVPIVVLAIEFRGRTFCDQPLWAYIAKLYGSYFIFPVFGMIAAICLVIPFAIILMILSLQNFRWILRLAVYFWIAFVVLASSIELFGSPRAVFEVAPRAFDARQGVTVYEKLSTICRPQFAYASHFDTYQADLQNLLQDKNNRSFSGEIYLGVIPFQIALHATLLSVFLLAIYLKKPLIDKFLATAGLEWVRSNFFVVFGLSLIIGSIWCIYRLSYRIDQARAFGGEHPFLQNNPLLADYLIFGLYFIVVTLYIIFAGFDLEKVAKTSAQVAAAAGVLGFSAVAPLGYTSQFFGIDASIWDFIGMVVVLLILIALGLLFSARPPELPPPEPEDG
jgi:hypothetical protein